MEQFISLLDSTIRVATPLVLAALAGLFSERSGIVDISLEGKMLLAAFASAAAAFAFHSPWIGLLAGIAVSVAFAMLHGFVSVTYNGNQLISGMSINIIASGITPVLALAWFQQGGTPPSWSRTAASPKSRCRSPTACARCQCWGRCTASCYRGIRSWYT